MSPGHQLIIDCGLTGDNSCQLRDGLAKNINIQVQQAFSQYHYYLLIVNHQKNNCQLSVQAQTNQDIFLNDYSAILIKIFYQNQQLFAANVTEFLSRKIELLNLPAQSSKLYKLEFYIDAVAKDFQLNFDLNFLLNCLNQPDIQEQNSQVLGVQTPFREITATQTQVAEEKSVREQRFLIFSALIVFLLLLFLILIFSRRICKKKKKY